MKEVQELVGIVPWTFVAQICNLFLTVFLVKKFLFDRINKVVEERKQMADSQIADATKAKEEAKTMRDQYEASISNAKDEARQIIADAVSAAAVRSPVRAHSGSCRTATCTHRRAARTRPRFRRRRSTTSDRRKSRAAPPR